MKKGMITLYTLFFGTIFLFVFMSILSMVLAWHRVSIQNTARNSALHIAEAGIDYYKWYFFHFSDELLSGPKTYGPFEFQDPQGRVSGEFIIEAGSTLQCGEIGAVDIISTGWTSQFPNIKRKIGIRYARPAVSDFAFLLNSNVWIGPDHEVKGPYQSNGGIRMDGENHSSVTSARESWICTESFGCDPSEERPGVFTTANGREDLFVFPAIPFDFEGITGDIATIRNAVLPIPEGEGRGIYIPRSASGMGYHLILAESEIEVYEITGLNQVYVYNLTEGWHWEDSIITGKTLRGIYTLPSDCGAVFIEDNAWIEGIVENKTTIAVGDLIDPNVSRSVWISGDIEYSGQSGKDGSNGLLVISQKDVLIPLNAPDSIEIHGTFIAQTGLFGINHYPCSLYPDDCIKSYIEIFGSIVSNGRVGTQWVYSWGGIASGYEKRETVYDPRQSQDPSPFLPAISPRFEVIRWRELEWRP